MFSAFKLGVLLSLRLLWHSFLWHSFLWHCSSGSVPLALFLWLCFSGCISQARRPAYLLLLHA